MRIPTIREMKKFVVAVLGALAEIVNQGLITGDAAHWISIVIAVVTAAGVYVARNADSEEPID